MVLMSSLSSAQPKISFLHCSEVTLHRYICPNEAECSRLIPYPSLLGPEVGEGFLFCLFFENKLIYLND